MFDKTLTPFLLLALSLLACGGQKQPPADADKADKFCLDSNFRERLAFVKPDYGTVTETIHLTGSVEANPDRVVTFVSLVSGVVHNVHFSIGDRVQKGQILAEMHSAELSGLQSDLTTLKSKIEVAERKLKSVKAMFGDGVSSEKELMETQSELDVLQSELARTAANLNLYGASVTKGVFQIKAPASGIITSKTITSGSQISPESGALFTISDLSRIWIMANIYATNIKSITVGMEVGITTLSYPDESFRGKISNISPVMDEEAKVLKARIELPNQEMKLKPGMLVDINAFRPLNHTAYSLPSSSLVFDDNQNYVVLYKGDCDLSIQKVEVETHHSGTVYLSAAPDTTDLVVSKNQLLIFEQLKNFQY